MLGEGISLTEGRQITLFARTPDGGSATAGRSDFNNALKATIEALRAAGVEVSRDGTSYKEKRWPITFTANAQAAEIIRQATGVSFEKNEY